MRYGWLLLPLALGCGEVDEAETVSCDATADADADGMDDCAEEVQGTDPALADSDDDGFTDLEEVECLSDPLDPDQACYECGWKRNDPGDLESTGAKLGDVVHNIPFVDQCKETVQLWDFAKAYQILYFTAAW
jgi:hypothetical protein